MNTAKGRKDLSIFIASCDLYSDVWHPFFTLFFKYWSDCPYDIYLCSNFFRYDHERVNTICIGEEPAWSLKVKQVLKQIPTDYILYLQEDYLLTGRVDTGRVEQLFTFMKKRDGAYLRLRPTPPAHHPLPDNPDVGVLTPGTDYMTCTQAPIWKRETFYQLLNDNESIWDFEKKSPARAHSIEGEFLSVVRDVPCPIPYFCTAVVKGIWLRDAVHLCKKEGIKIVSLRRREGYFEEKFRKHFFPELIKFKKKLGRESF